MSDNIPFIRVPLSEQEFEKINKNLWITDVLAINGQANIFSSVFSKIAVCDVHKLSFCDQKLSFDEFKFLTCSGNVKYLDITKTFINHENGDSVYIDSILKCVPNVEIFKCYNSEIPAFELNSVNPFQNINTSKMGKIDIHMFSYSHFEKLFIFMKENPHIQYRIQFDGVELSASETQKLRVVVQEIIDTGMTEFWPPYIRFGGQTAEQLHQMISLIMKYDNQLMQQRNNISKRMTQPYFDVENISNGFGHGSIVYKLSIHFASQNDPSTKPETLSFALKIPSDEISYQQKLKIDSNLPKNAKEIISEAVAEIHKNECYFYTKISTFLNNFKIPIIYETKEWNILENEQGYILMEDLSEVGYVLSKYDFILEDRIKAVVKEISTMQAEWIKGSLKYDWKEVKTETNEEMWEKITNDFLSFIPASIELVDDIDNEILAFVDWQLVYEGSPSADLVRYIVRGTEASVRRKIEPTIFSFFIKCIRDLIPNLEIYESQIRKAYIYSFISEFVELLMITVNNTKSLQDLINNDENVAVNLNLKEKIICRTISVMEDISKFIDSGEFEDVVERF
uniref:CHK kinase-like domain-containing protein n=1 Tax=Panagrolaimus davidi TaxID=227884 RepID=A0A914QE22_9BILA